MVLRSSKVVASVSMHALRFCAESILVSQFVSRSINGNRDYFCEDNLQVITQVAVFTESQGITPLGKVYLGK